jgi:hypothetical protein
MNHKNLLTMSNEQRLAAVAQAFKDTGHPEHIEEDSETFQIANHIVTEDLELLRQTTTATPISMGMKARKLKHP